MRELASNIFPADVFPSVKSSLIDPIADGLDFGYGVQNDVKTSPTPSSINSH